MSYYSYGENPDYENPKAWNFTGFKKRTYTNAEYAGHFKNGLRHGKGTTTSLDSSYKHIGSYKNEVRHGENCIFFN